MNEIFKFNEGETVKDIPLQILAQSLMITDSKGRPPKNRPIQSWELVDTIHSLCTEAGLDVEIKHIYVPEKESTPVINKEEKDLYASGENIPINKWLFNKVGIVIHLNHPDDHESVTAIAAAFHEKGIQVGWGQQVSMCSNFCIFGANTLYTFGEDRMGFEKLMEALKNWIMQFEIKRSEDLAIIDGMKKFTIDDSVIEFQLDAIVGNLYRAAVRKNYMASETRFVFNMSQTSEFVQNLERKLQDHYLKVSELNEKIKAIQTPETTIVEIEAAQANIEVLTLWDLYNWGTEILKPETTDIANVFQVVTWWSKFLLEFIGYTHRMIESNFKEEDEHPLVPAIEDVVQCGEPIIKPEILRAPEKN